MSRFDFDATDLDDLDPQDSAIEATNRFALLDIEGVEMQAVESTADPVVNAQPTRRTPAELAAEQRAANQASDEEALRENTEAAGGIVAASRRLWDNYEQRMNANRPAVTYNRPDPNSAATVLGEAAALMAGTSQNHTARTRIEREFTVPEAASAAIREAAEAIASQFTGPNWTAWRTMQTAYVMMQNSGSGNSRLFKIQQVTSRRSRLYGKWIVSMLKEGGDRTKRTDWLGFGFMDCRRGWPQVTVWKSNASKYDERVAAGFARCAEILNYPASFPQVHFTVETNPADLRAASPRPRRTRGTR